MASAQTNLVEAPDFTKLLNASHDNQWVAFSSDYSRVLASAESISELLKKLSDKDKSSEPVFYKVPSKNTYYIPALQ